MTMITLQQYFGKWAGHADITNEIKENATQLLASVNGLFDELVRLKVIERDAVRLSTATYSGFRPKVAPYAAKSSHKEGKGIDVADRSNIIDRHIDKNPDLLVKYNLYRESGSATLGWCHLQTRPTRSGKRTFLP